MARLPSGNFTDQASGEAYLKAEGFTQSGEFWTKPSNVDDFYGGFATLAIVEMKEYSVAPQFGGGSYFGLWWH